MAVRRRSSKDPGLRRRELCPPCQATGRTSRTTTGVAECPLCKGEGSVTLRRYELFWEAWAGENPKQMGVAAPVVPPLGPNFWWMAGMPSW